MHAFIRHAGIVVPVSPGQLRDYVQTDDKGGAEGFRHVFVEKQQARRLFSVTNGVPLRERQRERFGMTMFDVHNEEDAKKFLKVQRAKQIESRVAMAGSYPQFWPASGGRSEHLGEDRFVGTLVSRVTGQKGIQYVAPFVRRVM
jgi:hypothetical protein